MFPPLCGQKKWDFRVTGHSLLKGVRCSELEAGCTGWHFSCVLSDVDLVLEQPAVALEK